MTTDKPTPVPARTPPNPTRRSKIHMHPAKRRLLLVLALGSVLGCLLMVATLRMIVAPVSRWSVSSHDAMTQLKRVDVDVERLRNATAASTQRMKAFLHQLQKLHAASTARTGLVEKAAAQSYREHARDRLREHFMAIKEGILLQTSQRRRIDDARRELRQMNLTAELLMLRMDPEASLEDQAAAIGAGNSSGISASSSLAKSIREIRVAILEHSTDAHNATMDELTLQVQNAIVGNFTRLPPSSENTFTTPPYDAAEHGLLVYVVVFGVLGVWLWNVITDERTRKTSLVFTTHRAFLRALGNLVVVEEVMDDSTDEEDF